MHIYYDKKDVEEDFFLKEQIFRLHDRYIESRTYSFLRYISNHIANHKRYNKLEYIVSICEDHIDVYPDVQVYVDKHHRKSYDLEKVQIHVCKYHMDIQDYEHEIFSNHFVLGVYRYMYMNKKRRKWIRVEGGTK